MQDTEVEKFWMHPSSEFIGSGYILHCGASFKDSNNKESMRYHAYFIPEGYKLPDGVHVVTGYDPVYNESDAEEESEDDDMSVDI